MREQETKTQVMNATYVRQVWSELLNKVFQTNTRVVVEKNGIPVAAIISPRELERFKRLEAQDAEHFRPLREVEIKRRLEALSAATTFRRQMAETRGGQPLPSSVEIIRQAREERSEQL
jgi:PHD/YefM family antitoxin component YafN of YafNO toxin-antitoxin module